MQSCASDACSPTPLALVGVADIQLGVAIFRLVCLIFKWVCLISWWVCLIGRWVWLVFRWVWLSFRWVCLIFRCVLPVERPTNRQPAAWLLWRSPPAAWGPSFPSLDTDLKATQSSHREPSVGVVLVLP